VAAIVPAASEKSFNRKEREAFAKSAKKTKRMKIAKRWTARLSWLSLRSSRPHFANFAVTSF